MATQFRGHWLRGLITLAVVIAMLAAIGSVMAGAANLHVPAGILAFVTGLLWLVIVKQLL